MDHRMQQLHLRRAWMQQRDPILCLSASDYIRKRERFKYDPLSQSAGTETIRLIKLLPGEAFAPIECTIFHIPLSQAYLHPYEALSYCWGDQTSKQAIMSNGMCIEVTFNLFTALYYLRRKDEPRILWVDAICINQADLQERNHQVTLMRDIYGKGNQTTVWLGEEEDESGTAMKLIHHLAEHEYDDIIYAELTFRKLTTIQSQLAAKFPRGFDAFFRLLLRPWFRRVWIVQEVAVSPRSVVLCGDAEASWEQLTGALKLLMKLQIHLRYQVAGIGHLNFIDISRQEFVNPADDQLLRALVRHQECQATDPRDKVYALCGLANAFARNPSLIPDYNRTPEQVYTDLAVCILSQRRSLDLLSVPLPLQQFGISAQQSGKYQASLPSWVPDWSREGSIWDLRKLDQKIPRAQFSASGNSMPWPSFNEDKSLLGLDGFVYDTIVECTRVLAPGEATSNIFHNHGPKCKFHATIKEWKKFCKAHVSAQCLQDGSDVDVFVKNLTGGDESMSYEKIKKDFQDWDSSSWDIRFLSRFPNMPSFLCNMFVIAVVVRATALRFLLRRSISPPNIDTAYNRRMARTSTGYICLVPMETQEGDKIGIFRGGKMPLVIRQNDISWQLIGDCYVHGIMKGEAWEKTKCKKMWMS
jgi:hypothetical protein